ncbi:site-specific integrase [Marinilabilia salmonicolor]|uniref:site-specific integrase n=1 Tax=Marinilabilia salmonicolor TaxID=989 RepID=UPI00029B4457|nr:site-specific integrase [Marinilabilia salmonicolor]
MASIKIILKKGKKYKDGKHPIVLRILHQQKQKIATLGLKAKPEEWNEDLSRFTSKVRDFKTKNQLIDNIETRSEQILNTLKKENKLFSFELFLTRLWDKEKAISLFEFYDIIIDELEALQKESTKNIYQASYSAIKKFCKNRDVSFYEINYEFLKQFEAFLFKNGNTGGGVHHHMRDLRYIFNEAIRRKHVSLSAYPFSTQFNKDGYSLSHLKSKATPRALSENDLQKFKSFDVEKYPHLSKAYYYFLFSYYARGMNFVDIAQLKKNDIYDNRLIYNRSKTNKRLNIKETENIQRILKHFNDTPGDYIFPILNEFHRTETQKTHRIKKILKKYNSDLKEIAKILQININLTSYVARHTFATTLKRNGISTEIISESLGHSELSTTKAYLEKFSNELLDKTDDIL